MSKSKKDKRTSNVVSHDFGSSNKPLKPLGPFELRCVVEALIHGQYGVEVEATEGGTIFLEWEGQQWVVDCTTVDRNAEADKLWELHYFAHGDEEEFIRGYRKWKMYVRDFLAEKEEEVPERFKESSV